MIETNDYWINIYINKMIETNDYWIVDNKLIFKPEFNNDFEKYNDLISNYNTLMFSNYSNVDICIETDNKYETKYHDNCRKSKFNQKIELPKNLTNLTFGNCFSQEIVLPKNLTLINFGYYFN